MSLLEGCGRHRFVDLRVADLEKRLADAMELLKEIKGYAEQQWGYKYSAEWDAEIARLEGKQ
jgi:hypothetical protein